MIKQLLILCLFSTSLYAANDKVVANVNGIKITKAELEERYRQNMLYVSDKFVTKQSVLDDLINRALGIQRAKGNKLQNNNVVKYKMEDILYHAQMSKDLEPEFKKIVVTDKDVETYYKSHPEYRTAHILFRVRAVPEKDETDAALTQALKVYKALQKNPNKFAEFANKYSQSSSAPAGGDIGYRPAIKLAPEYYEAIKNKANDFITPPVRTQFGYHIVKVLGKRDFSEINTSVYKKIVYDQKRDQILEQYWKDLRKNAKVKINSANLK